MRLSKAWPGAEIGWMAEEVVVDPGGIERGSEGGALDDLPMLDAIRYAPKFGLRY